MTYLAAFQDGLLAAQAGKKMIARLQFEQVVELSPDFAPGWLWLAWTADSPAQAIDYLTTAERIAPQNQLVCSYREVVNALANYDREQDHTTFETPARDLAESSCSEQPTEASEPVSTASETSMMVEIPTQLETNASFEDEVEEQPPQSNSDTCSFEEIQEELANICERAKQQIHTTDEDGEERTAPAPPHDATLFTDTDWDGNSTPDDVNTAETETVDATDAEGDQQDLEQHDLVADTSHAVDARAQPPNAEVQLVPDVTDAIHEEESAISPTEPASASQRVETEAKIEADNDVPTILAVDDSPTVRKLLTMTLKSGGYRVETAEDGVEAMKMLANITPNLILLDVNMPRMDGYKLCKLIKRHEKTKFIPVVMLSGKDGMFDKLRGTLVGCDDYIAKPFRSVDLLNHIEKYLTSVAT